MMRWVWLALGSIAYWAAWVLVAALVMWVHGDCWAGTTASEAAECANEKGIVGWSVLGLAGVLYVATLWGLKRKSDRADGGQR